MGGGGSFFLVLIVTLGYVILGTVMGLRQPAGVVDKDKTILSLILKLFFPN